MEARQVENVKIGAPTPSIASVGIHDLSTDQDENNYVAVDGNVSFVATFTYPIIVTGTPQFSFDIGGVTRTADYNIARSGASHSSITITSSVGGGDDENTAVFTYTVVDGDEDHDNLSWEANAVTLNGGTIQNRDATGYHADLHIPSGAPETEVNIGTTPPAVTSVDVVSTTTNGYYNTGGVIRIRVMFDGAIDATGSPAFTFGPSSNRSAWSATWAGTTNNEAFFTYTVQSADRAESGIGWEANAIDVSNGSITNTTGKASADLTHDAAGPIADHVIGTPARTSSITELVSNMAENHEDGRTTAYNTLHSFTTGPGENVSEYLLNRIDMNVSGRIRGHWPTITLYGSCSGQPIHRSHGGTHHATLLYFEHE